MRLRSFITVIAVIAILSAIAPAGAVTVVPPEDYSYAAITDLAHKGFVDGFSRKEKVFANRTFNRYEIASLVGRVCAKLSQDPGLLASADEQSRQEIQKLVQDYRVELSIIGVDVASADLAGRQSAGARAAGPQPATAQAVKPKPAPQYPTRLDVIEEAGKNTYGNTQLGRYSITGYIQARYVEAQSGSKKLFPAGAVSPGTSSGATNALSGVVNGSYGETGPAESAEVRRARIIFMGRPTANAYYRAQLDLSGACTTSTTPVKIKEAGVYYTPGDGSSKYPTFAAGQFSTPFGYIIPMTMTNSLTPERPLAFSESSLGYGLFNNQDYDKGLKVLYGPRNVKLTYALINGSGQNTENVYNHFDSVARVCYTTTDKTYSVGASYYGGDAYEAAPPTGVQPKKDLYGADAHFHSRGGAFVDAEYVAGTYEARGYFTGGTTTAGSFKIDPYVKGNQVQGYYVWGGYTFNQAGPRPFILGADYDVFQRSKTTSGGLDQLTSGTGSTNAAGSSYDDVNYGYGAMYYLDSSTRLRLWWDQPVSIAHAPGLPEPTRVGLLTGEIQVSF